MVLHKHIDALTEIPPYLYNTVDNILSSNICCITKKPIRFIYVPKGSIDDENVDVAYEKAEIEEWIRKSKGIPPGWPYPELAPTLENIEPDKSRQKQIKKDLIQGRVQLTNLHNQVKEKIKKIDIANSNKTNFGNAAPNSTEARDIAAREESREEEIAGASLVHRRIDFFNGVTS